MSIYEKVVAHSELEKAASTNIPLTGMQELGKGFSSGMGKALAVGAMGLGALAAGSALSRMKNGVQYNKFQNSLNSAIARSPILQQYPEEKVRSFANTLFRFAPNVVTDVNVLSQILSNTLMGDSIDPNTIKTITDMEGRMLQNSSIRAFR